MCNWKNYKRVDWLDLIKKADPVRSATYENGQLDRSCPVLFEYLVNNPVFQCFLGRHEVVAIHVFFNSFDGLPSMVSH